MPCARYFVQTDERFSLNNQDLSRFCSDKHLPLSIYSYFPMPNAKTRSLRFHLTLEPNSLERNGIGASNAECCIFLTPDELWLRHRYFRRSIPKWIFPSEVHVQSRSSLKVTPTFFFFKYNRLFVTQRAKQRSYVSISSLFYHTKLECHKIKDQKNI